MLSLILILNVVALVLYGVVSVIYRLFFHPLAKFPGPKIAAATKWYEFYHDILKGRGLFADEVRAMHIKYGPIVRINPDELHVDDPEWYDILYANNPSKRDKWPPAANMVGTGLAGFGTVEHALHAKRRAALGPLFTSKAIVNANETMQEQIAILSNALHRKFELKEVVELRTMTVAFSMDTIYQYAMGDTTGLQRDEEKAKWWWLSLEETTKLVPIAKQIPGLVALGQKLPMEWVRKTKPELAGLLGIHKEMHARAKQYLAHEEKSSGAAPDEGQKINDLVFRTICNSALPAEEKNLDRLAQEAFTVIVAGGETTSRMLEQGIFYILSNPLVLKRLHEEVGNIMPDASEMPPTKALEGMTYINAIVKEVLRISALVTSRLPVMPHEELRYGDWVIPRMTPVGMTPHDVLLDQRVFAEPHRFDPERWIQNPGLNRYLVAFGKGTRMCQGMRFALAELNMALLMIFRRFDLELYDTTKARDVDYAGDGFLGVHVPGSLGVRVRVVGTRT